MYSDQFLINAINSDFEVIAVWAAYQILHLDEGKISSFIPYFLESPFTDIRDAGIAKIDEIGDKSFVPELTRIFQENEGTLKYASAISLSSFPNDITILIIQKWFESLLESDQTTRVEFEAAALSYIKIDKKNHYPKIQAALKLYQHDVIKSSVLLINLIGFVESEQEYAELIDQYFIFRELFSDADVSYQLIEALTQLEITEWWTEKLSQGYSISSIYEQCHLLLGYEDGIDNRLLWKDIEDAYGNSEKLHSYSPSNPHKMISSIGRLVDGLLQNSETEGELLHLRWVIRGFEKNSKGFPKTIPKIIEMESHFLLTIPIYIILEQSVRNWVRSPTVHLENIANYYHSTLLTRRYREEILTLFFPDAPVWSEEQVKITKSTSPVESEYNINEVLWAFYRGDLLGYDIPWPSIFPNPEFSVHLSEGIFKIYFHNFTYYIEKKDKVSIDYALQLFQTKSDIRIVRLIKEHFGYLSLFHTETLYQTIEYLPDKGFINLLLEKYQKGEFEIARLIFLISTIYGKEIPDVIKDDRGNIDELGFQNSGLQKPVRLHCSSCNNTFQYQVDIVYVDEGSILRTNKLSSESVWVNQTFHCKKCSEEIAFILDETQLEEFSLQSRVDRILRITPQTKVTRLSQRISLIDFPRHAGRVFNPSEFKILLESVENDPYHNTTELNELLMKQARLDKSMGNWTNCKTVLEKSDPRERENEEWMFLMGLSSYKLSLIPEAREYFNRIIREHNTATGRGSFSTYFEQSTYYIKAMDSDNSRRSRFKLITGKK